MEFTMGKKQKIKTVKEFEYECWDCNVTWWSNNPNERRCKACGSDKIAWKIHEGVVVVDK